MSDKRIVGRGLPPPDTRPSIGHLAGGRAAEERAVKLTGYFGTKNLYFGGIIMQNKKKVITANHVLFVGGLIGVLLILISMGINWARSGTPFIDGLGLFQNPIANSLFLLAWPIGMSVWGFFELRKK